MANGANAVAEKPAGGTYPNKKNPGRAPKKIHKAEREKLKRDHLNELFLVLGRALEPAQQNSGKASVLGDATRILQDLIAQVGSLKKENSALVTESRYVTVERNELRDENTALEADISRLENELRERMHSEPLWCNGSDATTPTVPQPTNTALPMQQPPVRPIYVIPLPQDLQQYPDGGTSRASPKPPSRVRKPHARYPTLSDSWPLEILSGQPRTAQYVQHSGGSSSSMSDGGEEGSDKALASPSDK